MATPKQEAYYERLRADPDLLRERGSRGGKATADRHAAANLRKRLQCGECGMESNLGALARHQKASGHETLREVAA